MQTLGNKNNRKTNKIKQKQTNIWKYNRQTYKQTETKTDKPIK